MPRVYFQVFGSLMRPLPAPKKGKSLPEPLAEDKAEEHKSLTEYSEMAVQQLDETCKKELGEPLNVDPEVNSSASIRKKTTTFLRIVCCYAECYAELSGEY